MKNKLKIILPTIAILFLILFMFVYIPIYVQENNIDLENTYYVWAVIGSVATVVAVGVAIWIAKKQNKIALEQVEITKKQYLLVKEQAKILEQQNKIGLFDKRYEVYQELLKIRQMKTIPEAIFSTADTDDRDYFKKIMREYLAENLFKKNKPTIDINSLMYALEERIQTLNQTKLLFSKEKFLKEFETLHEDYFNYASSCILDKQKKIPERRAKFIVSYDKFGEDIIAQVEKTLKL